MTVGNWFIGVLERVKTSVVIGDALEAAIWFFVFVIVLGCLIVVVSVLQHFLPANRALVKLHKFLIYMVTMSGVLLLVIAGFAGLALPIIPGIPLILAGLLLMRKYHKILWLEKIIAYCKRKVHDYRRRYR